MVATNAYRFKREDAAREIVAVEDALRAGYPVKADRARNKRGCFNVAAEKLGVPRSALLYRVGRPGRPGLHFTKLGLAVNWSVYQEKAEPQADPVIVRKLRDENSELRAKLTESERRNVANENIIGGVSGLFIDLPQPRHLNIKKRPTEKLPEIPLINLFDLQWGEVVNLAQMDGLNSYNAKIAEARLGRFFANTIDLLTKHWHGPRPPRAYLALGGDLVSGEIHEELTKTNDRSSIQGVYDLVCLLEDGIERTQKALDCEIEIVSVPGNHGRITKKPEGKRYVVDSFDTLVAQLLGRRFNRPGSKINVTVPASGDALVNIYGRNVLWTHGDRLGTRGGHGGAGTAAPAARGMRKVMAEYAARGTVVHYIIVGHMHVALELEDGWVSSSLVGPSEYSRDGRFKPRPATQWLLTMHPTWGIAQRWQIQVGDPSEGSLYRAPGAA